MRAPPTRPPRRRWRRARDSETHPPTRCQPLPTAGSYVCAARWFPSPSLQALPFEIASQLVLRVQALDLALELVERRDVRFRRGDDDVGIRADAIHHAAASREPHGYLALRFGARRDRVHGEKQQLGATLGDRLDRLEGGVDRAVALRFRTPLAAIPLEHDGGARPLAHAARLAHGDEMPVLFGRAPRLLGDERLQILVEDLGLLVREVLEALERLVVRILTVELDAELLQPLAEGITPGQFAEHYLVRAPADVLGAHDLVGLARLEHAVLVNAGSVRKGVRAHDCLVRLHDEAGDLRHEARGGHDLRRVEARLEVEEVGARAHGHDDLFERGIAGALAQTVDGALDLPGAADLHRGERVGDREAEVVVAMDGPDGLVRVRNAAAQLAHEFAELLRHRVAHRVRDVDRGRAFVDHRLEHAAEEVELGAAAVFRRELDVGAGIAGKAHREPRLLIDLFRRHAQLLLHVERARGDERMDAPRTLGPLERVDAALDVAVVRPAQAADGGLLHGIGDGAHRLEVAVGGGREARLDYVHAHALERARDAQLFVARHRGAGALLPVAHGGVEYDQALFAHGMSPWPLRAGHSTDCKQEYLAREAQQQAAQREEREREKRADRLLHARHYSGIRRT